ncbi:hypothetical protein K458DRAFT_420639 [Lentithecium fluviatile CBS 122367]|uniref:DUF6590 domain-containing protein n=1 Tax=Lentithecium fluviatile CBS 122367 TaxID=1168545 RepID=A0A6G1IU12_9PLEO|nr:hypothetical protein K458DRAFT_420639 [Lentithecium fluviatile CBS 122367]
MFTGLHPPPVLASELPRGPWELPMGDPIRVLGDKPWDKMDPRSRVNFLKIYTVEHYVKVHHFGVVDPQDEWTLVSQFNRHWHIREGQTLPPATRPSENNVPAYAPGPRMMTPISEHQTPGSQQNPYGVPYQNQYQGPRHHPNQPPYQGQYQQANQSPYQQPGQAPYQNPYQAPYQAQNQPLNQFPYGAPPQPQQQQYPGAAPQQRPRTHGRSGSHSSNSSHGGRSKYPDDYRR